MSGFGGIVQTEREREKVSTHYPVDFHYLAATGFMQLFHFL